MPIDISHCPAVLLIWSKDDCGACDEYLPRLFARIDAHAAKYRFVFHEEGQAVPKGAIPVVLYDVMSPDPELNAFADRCGVRVTPTTIAVLRDSSTMKFDGSLASNQIDYMLAVLGEAAKRG